MDFVVETGVGLSNANAYVSVVYADTYFLERGYAAWQALSTDEKQSAIINATDYIEFRFGSRFRGQKTHSTQALAFPRRNNPCDTREDVVPAGVVKAACEYAKRAHVGPLAPDPVQDASGRPVTKARRKIGPLEKEYQFSDKVGFNVQMFPNYPAADALLKCYLYSTSGRVMRA